MHCLTAQKKKPLSKIIMTEIFLRDGKFSRFRTIVPQINFIDFLEPSKDWLKCNGDLNNKLFWTDHLHLSKLGNKKFALSVFTLL